MNNIAHDALRDPIESSFAAMDDSEQLRRVLGMNIGLASMGGADVELDVAIEEARLIGYTPFRWQNIISAVSDVITTENIPLPAGRKATKERGDTIDRLLNRFSFVRDGDGDVRIYLTDSSGNTITEVRQKEHLSDKGVSEAVHTISNDPVINSLVLGKIIKHVSAYVRGQNGLIFGESRAGQIDIGKDPHFLIEPSEKSTNRQSIRHDDTIEPGNPSEVRRSIQEAIRRQASLRARQEEIKQLCRNGLITVVPSFSFDDWPTDVMMTRLRRDVAPITDRYIDNSGLLCDDRDLKYQTLFRLTTYDVAEIFEGGSEFENYLRDIGAFYNWRNILGVDQSRVDALKLNRDLVDEVVGEQAAIIERRLAQSKLPLPEILLPKGMFGESGWYIQKKNGRVFATKDTGDSYVDEDIELSFREIETGVAEQYHSDLHYIHTPRVEKAFGMFVDGEELPFSVLSLQRVDREYKKNALLYQGYDPDKCYDLTRLYSRPGTPGNASSAMFSLVFSHLRSETNTQAVLSAFMPSYATGVSMTSSGMDRSILIKPLHHSFIRVDGGLFEHMTRRRLDQAVSGSVVHNRVPLLPVVELMCPIQKPRFDPVIGANTHMLETAR